VLKVSTDEQFQSAVYLNSFKWSAFESFKRLCVEVSSVKREVLKKSALLLLVGEFVC